VSNAAVVMPIASIATGIPTAFLVLHGTLVMENQLTLINICPMSTYKAQPNGCRNGTSPRKSANNTKSTEMERTYASIISTALEYLKA